MTLVDAIGVLSGLGAVGVTYKVIPPIWRWCKRRFAVSTRLDDLAAQMLVIAGHVETAAKELAPNGGGSVKDAINEIRRAVRRQGDIQIQLMDTVEAASFMTDSAGQLTWANKAYLEFVGRDLPEVQGFGWKNCVHQDDRHRVSKEWTSAIADQRSFSLNYRFVTHTGAAVDAYVFANQIDGGWLGFVRFRTPQI